MTAGGRQNHFWAWCARCRAPSCSGVSMSAVGCCASKLLPRRTSALPVPSPFLSVSISAISGSIILTKACEVFSFQGFSQRRGEHGRLGIFRQKFVGESPSSALWRLSMTAGVPACYTPDSANSAWEVFFKFDELFQFLAAHTNAS